MELALVKFARFPLQRPFYCWPFGNISHVGTHVLHKTQLHLAWKNIRFSLPLNMLDGHEWCVDQRKDKERWRGAEHSREEVCWLLVGSRPRPRLSAPSSTSTLLPQYFYSTDEQSGALANLSPNDQRHITTPTRSSSPPRFGKCQTGSPSVLPASHSKPWTQIDFYFWLPHLKYVMRAPLLLLMSWVALSFKLCECVSEYGIGDTRPNLFAEVW